MANEFKVEIGAQQIYDTLIEVRDLVRDSNSAQAVVNAQFDGRIKALEQDNSEQKTSKVTFANRATTWWTAIILAAAALVANFLPLHH